MSERLESSIRELNEWKARAEAAERKAALRDAHAEEAEATLAAVRKEAEPFASRKLGPPTEEGHQFIKKGLNLADRILSILDEEGEE